MLTVLVNLSLALVCVKAPALIERLGLTRKGSVTLSFLNLIVWVPLIMAFLLSRVGIAPVWFALLWFVNLWPALLLSVQRDNWLSNLVPRGLLGRYLGQRLAIKSAFYLGSFILLGYLLDAFGKDALGGFAFVFTLAMVASLVDFIIFTFMKEHPDQASRSPRPPAEVAQFGFKEYFGELKEKKLQTFVTFTSLFYLTVGLCGPLYAVYMLTELHFSYLGFTAIISAEYFARIVSVPFWGRFADKAGNIRVLGIVSRVIPLIPVFWLFWSNIGYLAVVQTVSGICWGAYDLSTQSYLYKVAPQEKKLRYIVFTRCLVLFSTALGGLAGAFFVTGIFPIFGSRILSIFLLSGVFRAVIVMYMMPRLIDLAVSLGQPSKSPACNLETLGKAIASRRGLYYRRQLPAEAPAVAPSRKNDIGPVKQYLSRGNDTGAVKEYTPRKKAAVLPREYSPQYQRRQWLPLEAPAPRRKEVAVPDLPPASPRGWYHRPEVLAAYAMKRPAATLPVVGKGVGRSGSPASLYYNSSSWASYMKDTLKTIIRESREDWKGVLNPRTPCVVCSESGVPGEIRTHDPLLRRQLLCPAELQGRALFP